jgi:hypothetical protein
MHSPFSISFFKPDLFPIKRPGLPALALLQGIGREGTRFFALGSASAAASACE